LYSAISVLRAAQSLRSLFSSDDFLQNDDDNYCLA